MANKEENNLENFTRKLFQATSLENTGLDFTDKVMAQLPKTEVLEEVFKYQPLISRRAWIISGIVAVLSFSLLLGLWDNTSVSIFNSSNLDLNLHPFNWFSKLFTVFNYKISIISILIFSLYFMLEVFVLNTWNKKGTGYGSRFAKYGAQ